MRRGRQTLTPPVGIEPVSDAGRVRVRKTTLSCWNAGMLLECSMNAILCLVWPIHLRPKTLHNGLK